MKVSAMAITLLLALLGTAGANDGALRTDCAWWGSFDKFTEVGIDPMLPKLSYVAGVYDGLVFGKSQIRDQFAYGKYETISSERRSLAQQLETLASESEGQRSRDQRRLDDLQRRLAESEAARGAALQRVEELETALAEASAALLAGEKRREAQAVALQAQKNRLDERGRQLAALEARQQQSAAEAYELKRRVSAAEQRHAQAQQEAQATTP